MKFRFRFKSLLKVKEHNMTMQQILLNHLTNDRDNSLRIVKEIHDAMLRFDKEIAGEHHSDLPVNRFRVERGTFDDAALRIMREDRKIRKLETRVAEQKQRLLEASRDVKILKNIEERDRLKWFREQEQRELAEANELATLMYNRHNDE